MSQSQIGRIQILASAFFFGFLGVFGKSAYAKEITPIEFLSLRFLLSSIFLAPFIFFRSPNSFLLSKREFFVSVLLGVFGYAVFSSCFFLALEGASASVSVLLLYTFPAFVMLGGFAFFSEQINRPMLLALFFSVVGIAALVWGDWHIEKRVFILFGLASAFFYSVYILASRYYLAGENLVISSFYIQLAAGITLALIVFHDFDRPIFILNENPGLMASAAFFGSTLPLTLFLLGLQKISASETSILSTADPICGVLLAVIILGDSFSPIQIFGGVILIVAMILSGRGSNRKLRPVPEPQ